MTVARTATSIALALLLGIVIGAFVPERLVSGRAEPPPSGIESAPSDQARESGGAESLDSEVRVSIEPALRGQVIPQIEAIGVVSSAEGAHRVIASRAGGRIVHVAVVKGQFVHGGDAIVEFEKGTAETELEVARARLAHATIALECFDRSGCEQQLAELRANDRKAGTDLELAESRLTREQSLKSEGLLAVSVLETATQVANDAKRAAELARSAREHFESHGAELERASLLSEIDEARATLSDAEAVASERRVEAPCDGIVTDAPPEIGTILAADAPIVTLLTSGERVVTLSFTVADSRRIAVGAKVTFMSNSTDYDGRVRSIAESVDPVTGLVEVVVEIQSRPDPLIIGDVVRGWVELEAVIDAITIPESAVVRHEDRLVVYVVDASGIAHRQPIESVGRRSGRRIVRGLEGSEQVITKGAYNLPDGAHVLSGE